MLKDSPLPLKQLSKKTFFMDQSQISVQWISLKPLSSSQRMQIENVNWELPLSDEIPAYLPPVCEYDAESGDGEKAHRAHAGRHHHQAEAGSRGLGPRAVLHCLEVSYAWKWNTIDIEYVPQFHWLKYNFWWCNIRIPHEKWMKRYPFIVTTFFPPRITIGT